jgi:hypothetical protein
MALPWRIPARSMATSMTFTPCSKRHRSCSPAHADLVQSYRVERWRQERIQESMTGNYRGDIEHVKAKGHTLIDFRAWLKAHRRDDA